MPTSSGARRSAGSEPSTRWPARPRFWPQTMPAISPGPASRSTAGGSRMAAGNAPAWPAGAGTPRTVEPGRAAPPQELPEGIGAEDLRALYRYMLLQRTAEERIIHLYRQGAVVGACFTGYGHEAIAVGAAYALGPMDVAATLHRDLGARLVLGMPVRLYFANFLGRTGSPTRGREGNLHIGGLGPRILLHTDFIGANVAVAAGAALAFAVRREERVAMAFFGEGALATGEYHEGVNLAAVQRLPLALVCWNNQFALSTPVAQEICGPIVERMAGYGMPASAVDGNDVLAVYRAARTAVDRARRGPELRGVLHDADPRALRGGRRVLRPQGAARRVAPARSRRTLRGTAPRVRRARFRRGGSTPGRRRRRGGRGPGVGRGQPAAGSN